MPTAHYSPLLEALENDDYIRVLETTPAGMQTWVMTFEADEATGWLMHGDADVQFTVISGSAHVVSNESGSSDVQSRDVEPMDVVTVCAGTPYALRALVPFRLYCVSTRVLYDRRLVQQRQRGGEVAFIVDAKERFV
jgi:mannose-6-phosphate isomerase-like protein (cupin superfamily)